MSTGNNCLKNGSAVTMTSKVHNKPFDRVILMIAFFKINMINDIMLKRQSSVCIIEN